MCGLVAMVAKTGAGFSYKDKTLFSQMLYADALRGFDSTGAFCVNKYHNLSMIKSAQPASTFLTTKAYEDFLNKAYQQGKVLVGHNRAATKGEKTDENAHPFIEGNTCLVHNGTLHSHKHLKDVTVDSHAITHSIDERGFEETYQDMNGAFALIWYDAEKKRVNIVRNKERPLWILETDTVDYIASEPDMLIWLYERNFGDSNKYQTKYFTTECLYYYDMEDLKDGFQEEALPEKKASPGVVPAYTTTALTTTMRDLTTLTTKQPNGGHLGGYKYNDIVLFELTSYRSTGDTCSIIGTILDEAKTRCVLSVSVENEAEELELLALLEANLITAKVYGFSTKAGVSTILLTDGKVATTYSSCNGILFTEEEFYSEVCTCTDCGNFIDPEVQDGLFWVRHKKGKVKATKCVHCVSKDPHLKHMIGNVDVTLL